LEAQAGLAGNGRLGAVALELGAEVGGAAILPDDGVADGLAGVLVPDDGGLALVGYAYGGDGVGGKIGARKRLVGRSALAGPDFHGVVLDPARLGVDLLKILLGEGDDAGVAVEDDGAGAGSSLVEGENVLGSGHGRQGG